MMGKSHRLGGALAMMGTFEYMRFNGMLLPDINPYLQLAIMYPASAFGAVVPDIDHHKGSNPVNTPMGEIFHYVAHTPTRFNKRYNRIHIGVDAEGKPKYKVKNKTLDKILPLKHRAWQTHSILFTGSLLFLLWSIVSYYAETTQTLDWTLISIIVFGFIVGVASHLLLDAMTTDGIFFLATKKIRIVPNNPYFKAGGDFETTIFKKAGRFTMWFLVFMSFTGLFEVNSWQYILDLYTDVQIALFTDI